MNALVKEALATPARDPVVSFSSTALRTFLFGQKGRVLNSKMDRENNAGTAEIARRLLGDPDYPD